MAIAQMDIRNDVEGLQDYPRLDIIYDEVPEGMIDLPSAARKHGLNRATLRILAGRWPYQSSR